jgi:hypothetical protein
VSGPGIKILAQVARIRVPSLYPANNGLDPDSFFFLFDFSFSLMPLTIKMKGVEQKAKAKAKAKAIRTSFLWLRCVLWCGYLFLSFIVKLAFFLSIFWPMAADPDRSQRTLCPGPD